MLSRGDAAFSLLAKSFGEQAQELVERDVDAMEDRSLVRELSSVTCLEDIEKNEVLIKTIISLSDLDILKHSTLIKRAMERFDACNDFKLRRATLKRDRAQQEIAKIRVLWQFFKRLCRSS